MTDQIQTEQNTNVPSQPSFSVPEAYQDRGWAKDIKSPDDLWKLTDNAQSLIGKRPAGIPTADAPEEEWQKFYNAAGRPDSPDKYTLPDVEGLPEGLDLGPQKQTATKILHEAGLTQKQAEKVWSLYMKAELEAVGGAKAQSEEAQKALDAEFDQVTQKVFGDKYDASAKAAQDMINAYVPDELKDAYGALGDNPKALAAVISALSGAKAEIDKVKAEYGAEGSITSGAQTTSASIEDVRSELANLRISQAARDFTHPDHKKSMQRIEELTGQVNRHYKTL